MPGRSWGQRLVITSGALLAVVAMIGALVVAVAWWRLGSFDRVSLDLAPQADNRPLNFLVVGSDSRAGVSENDADAGAFLDEEISGQRTDTIILMRVDPADNSVSLLSIPRDLWVPLGGTGAEDRINVAFAEGGAQELINTVRSVLDITINHYVEVNFGGFKALVDTIGGVPMYFDTPMLDEYSGLAIPKAGCVVLDGQQALAFARSRHLQYLDAESGEYYTDLTADLGRITRQQLFLRQAMDKATSLGLTNVTKLNRLVGVATDNITFDDDMTNSELLSLAKRFASIDSSAMKTFALPTELSETSEGASVVLLKELEAKPVLDVFRGVVPTTSTTGAPSLSPAAVTVDVRNGTGVVGQATDTADALRAIGFGVGQVGNAATAGAARTTLRHGPSATAAAKLVAGYLQPGVALVVDTSLANTVVLITGADFTGVTVPDAPAPGATVPGGVPEVTTTAAVGVAPPGQPPPGITCE